MDHNKVIIIVISTVDMYVVFCFTIQQLLFKLWVVATFGSVHCNVRIIALECHVVGCCSVVYHT